eukprot:5103698-Karenia_brevis.AAC.1
MTPVHGWEPTSLTSKIDFQRSCLQECGIDERSSRSGLTLDGVEKIVGEAAVGIQFSTARSRHVLAKKMPEEMTAAKSSWKAESCQIKRKAMRKVYCKLKRAHMKS